MNWYRHPTLPYEVSTDLQVRRIPGKGSPNGRLLHAQGSYALSHEGRVQYMTARQLLKECLATHEAATPAAEEEVWKTHPDFPQVEISDLGRARYGDTHKEIKSHLYKGMMRVKLYTKDKRRVPATLANLVGDLFLPPRPTGAYAYHKDGDRSNCRADNLTWEKPPKPTATPQKKKSKRGPLTPRQLWAMQYGRQRQKKER